MEPLAPMIAACRRRLLPRGGRLRFLPVVLALVSLLGRAAPVARFDFGTISTAVQPGWTAWAERGDGFGPVRREVPPGDLVPNGCVVELGPAKALGCRSAKPAADPRAALVSDSFFARAETPPTVAISGLPKGEFRVVLWFNDARGFEWPPVTVLLDDAAGQEQVAAADVPQGSTGDSAKAGRADFLVRTDGENPVRIATRIPVVPGTRQYVFLCGLEILDAASFSRASLPVPEQGTRNLPRRPLRLSWLSAGNAAAQTLLLGDSPENLAPVAENPRGNTWLLAEPRFGSRYFWRVDAVLAGASVPGEMWEFAIESGQATRPLPLPETTAVSTRPTLRWRLPPGAKTADLWLGTAPDQLTKQAGNLAATAWSPGDLLRDTRYFWRIDTNHDGEVVPGALWQFQTAKGGARLPLPTDGETGVDADTALRWTPSGGDAVPTLWVGDSPDRLQAVSGTVANGWHRLPLPLGKTQFWRVDERYGEELVTGPLWRFTVGQRLRIDDFEDYTTTQRVSGIWLDGRADPANGARVALSEDGLHALVIQGRGEVRRTFAEPRDWQSPGADTLRARLAGPLQIALVDADGKEAAAELLPTDGVASIPLAAFANVDLGRITGVVLRRTAGAGTLWIDDLELTGPVAPSEPEIGELAAIRGAPAPPEAAPGSVRELRADVCVVGGGSGGIGAAVAAARAGATVLLVEREAKLGGTSTMAYVQNWEPGPGCPLAREIADRLARYADGRIITRATDYEGTLSRAAHGRVGFEIEPFHEVVLAMLRETGRGRVLLGTTFVRAAADRDQRRVEWIEVVRNGERYRIRARAFVDSTGSGFLCQTVGCETMLGAEPKSRFGEPSAPENPQEVLNAIELCYRIRRSPHPVRQELPEGRSLRRGGAAWPLPSGDLFVNTCGGLAPGWLLMKLGYEEARAELELRVRQHWHWLQQDRYPEYEFDSFAPMLAIRESHRIVGEYVLREQDVQTLVNQTPHPDIVAIADHPLDTHGAGGGLGQVATPYGIPYRCLVPKGPWRNLLVACRGASFSHIAASSCRLSRTMLALGHAAGLAAAETARTGTEVMAVDLPGIQAELNLPLE